MPYPKYIPKGKQRHGRKKGRSRILTDTPEKDALIAELKEKENVGRKEETRARIKKRK